MKIIVDTREQSKLLFNGLETIEKKLDFADYGCEMIDGTIVPVVFERKSINDLYGTLSAGYERFKREVERCKESKFSMIIIIEGTLTKVSRGIKHSQRSPDSLLSQLFTLFVRYRIIPIFCKDPDEASKFITLFYTAYEKNHMLINNINTKK